MLERAKYFEEQSLMGYSKSLVYFSSLMSELWRVLEAGGEPDETIKQAKSLVARAAVFIDQTAAEGGSHYELGWLMTGLEQPNWAAIQSRANYRGSGGLVSRLADPRIVAVNQAYLKEQKLVEDRVQAGHGQKTPQDLEKEKEKKAQQQKAAEERKAAAARRKADGKGDK